MSIRRLSFYLSLAFLAVVLIGLPIRSQYVETTAGGTQSILAGRNVNMVSGTKLPFGDPWLQRQNEPSIAVSTRNPMHLFAGANDYRTIDVPENFQLPGIEGVASARDAWLGVFESFDGGQSWMTTLLPGYPTDNSTEGQLSPIHGLDTACDPIVRAGANGLFYYCGIAFNRDQTLSKVFVARYMDNNNLEKVEVKIDQGVRKYFGPIQYIDTRVVAIGGSNSFVDMPNLAVDVPRKGALYGNIYVAYTVFSSTSGSNVQNKIFLQRSTDGGVTWSTPPVQLSITGELVQRPVIAIDPIDLKGNTIYVAFRRFAGGSVPGGIVVVRSTDGGKTFRKLPDVAALPYPFDQGTSYNSFRTNSYPTMAIDGLGTVYVAWSQRQWGADGQARIMISAFKKGGLVWSTPKIVDQTYTGIGHQFMPSLTFAGWKLMLAWYDQREDLAKEASQFIVDSPGEHRHTIDVRAAEGTPGVPPSFSPSIQLSRYLYVLDLDSNGNPIEENGYYRVIQAESNPINYPLFQQGTVPFHGDYMEITPSPRILPPAIAFGFWVYNISPLEPTIYHTAWTDNRDVKPPNGNIWGDWVNYSAPASTQDSGWGATFPCSDGSKTGMRNQNVYTANINKGIIVGSPGNTKQLDLPLSGEGGRTFVVFIKNTTEFERTLNLVILQIGRVNASFDQFKNDDYIQVKVRPYSSVSCTVYVDRSSRTLAPVTVNAFEGIKLVGYVVLNPDPTNLPLSDPDNPFANLGNETHDPDVSAPLVWNYDLGDESEPNASAVLNPRVQNPRVQNYSVVNPRVQNTGVLNPRVQNESIVNNEVPNPRVQNAVVPNGALTDVTWTVTNEGNTTSAFTANIQSQWPEYFNGENPSLIAQVLVYKVYKAPVDKDCQLYETHQDELMVNISNPRVQNPRVQNITLSDTAMSIQGSSMSTQAANLSAQDVTFNLAPGDQADVIFRVWDEDTTDGSVTFSPNMVIAEAVAEAVNTDDVEEGSTTPPYDTPPNSTPWDPDTPLPSIVAVPSSLSFVQSSSQTLSLSLSNLPGEGSLAYTLSVDSSWLSVSPTGGSLSGTPTVLTVTVDDTGINPGNYAGFIVVTVPEVSNNPLRIPVFLNKAILLPAMMNIYVSETWIDNGGSYDFGTHSVGSTTDETFRIENISEGATGDLVLNGNPIITIIGANADQFSVQQQPTSPVISGDYTSFIIRFQPTSPGLKTAAISIINNTLDKNPYDITLLGNGAPLGGLVAYYPFNGNANDESGNGHNGTIHGNPTYSEDRNGNPSGALNFDGTSNYVELPDESSFDLPQISIVAIVKVPNYAKRNPIISKGSNFGSFTVHIVSTDGLPYYTYQNSTGNETEWLAYEPVGQNQFFHLVSTYDSASRQLRGYLNGVLKHSMTCLSSPLMNNENVTIGLTPPNEFFNGVIDEIRIYDRVLSDSEIQSLYQAQSAYIANAPPWSGGWVNIVPANQVGQSFTTTSPLVLNVDVNILTGNAGPPGDTITMKILSSGGAVLMQGSKYVASGFDGWLTFYLSEGLAVPPGTTLRLQLEDTNLVVFGWRRAGDTYPYGQMYFYGSAQPSEDLFFRINYH